MKSRSHTFYLLVFSLALSGSVCGGRFYRDSTNLLENLTLNGIGRWKLKNTLDDHIYDNDGVFSKQTALRKIAVKQQVSFSVIINEMERVIQLSVLENWTEFEQWRFAVAACEELGYYKLPKTADTFLVAMKSSVPEIRAAALRGYIQVLREGSIPKVKEALLAPGQYESLDRFRIYRQLAFFADCSNPDNPRCREVQLFLLWAAEHEPDANRTRQLDEILALCWPEYRTSTNRRTLADRFQNNTGTKGAIYFQKVFNELENHPLDDLNVLVGN